MHDQCFRVSFKSKNKTRMNGNPFKYLNYNTKKSCISTVSNLAMVSFSLGGHTTKEYMYASWQRHMVTQQACPYLSLQTGEATDPQDLSTTSRHSIHLFHFLHFILFLLFWLLAGPGADPLWYDRCWNSCNNLLILSTFIGYNSMTKQEVAHLLVI